jgi:hypothetical protein
MVKPGDPAATEAMAGEFLSKLGTYFTSEIDAFAATRFTGLISNREKDAVEILEKSAPSIVFCPAGFYLKVLRDLPDATPVAEIPRFGAQTEQYFLVAARSGPVNLRSALDGRILTGAEFDASYLERVVFADRPDASSELPIEASDNLSDELFALLENDPSAGSTSLLLDTELKALFEEDDLVWPELQVIWESATLQRDLVVATGSEWNADALADLRAALEDMPSSSLGAEVLELMNSDGFVPVQTERMDRVKRLYDE